MKKPNHIRARQRNKDQGPDAASLIDNISDALISTDMEFNVLGWNAAAEQMYGWTAAEAIGQSVPDIFRTEYPGTTRDKVIEVLLQGGVWKGEVIHSRKDGTRFPVMASVSLLRQPTGEPVGFVTVNRDITDRKQVEERLLQSEERFSKSFDSAPTGLVLSRLSDSKFEYVNESFLKLVDHRREDVIGKNWVELNLFPDLAQIARVRDLLIETKQVRNMETRIRSSKGEIKHVLFSVDIILIDQQPYSLTTMVDVTERLRAEKQVVQMKRLYATLSQVNQTIVRVKNREELYQSICDVALKFGELTFAWIGLLDETTGDIRPAAASGMNANIDQWPFPIMNSRRGPGQNSVAVEALRTSNVVTSEDVQLDERTQAFHGPIKSFGFHSLAAVPFRLRGRTIGVLNLISVEPGFFKAEEELILLGEMGLDISFALDTMESEKQRKEAEEKVERQNRRLKILHEIDIAILAADSVENIASAALSHIRELINCQRAHMSIFDWGTNEALIFKVSAMDESFIPKGARVPLAPSQDLVQRLSQNQLVLIEDLTALPEPPPLFQAVIREGLRSVCILPLFSLGSLIGTFNMSSEIPGFFDEEKIDLGREVANQVAIAITHKRLLDELLESEEKYRAFFQNSMDAILLTSPDGSIHAANPAACRMFGRSEAEICAVSRDGLVDTGDPRLKVMLEERKQTGMTFGELTMLRQDGSPFPVEMSSALFQDKQGSTRTSMIIRDITERKNAEKQILQMKRLYATLSQVNQTIVRVQSREELYQSICDVAVQFGEFSLAWIGLLDEVTGDVKPVAACGLDITQWPFQVVNIREGVLKDGLIATAIRTSRVMTSEDMKTDNRLKNLYSLYEKYADHASAAIPFRLRGTAIGVVSLVAQETGLFRAEEEVHLLEEMGFDISFALEMIEIEKDRRLGEEKLRSSEERFSSAFRASPAGITITRIADGKFIDANESFCRIFEFSRDEVVGHTSTELNMWTPEERKRLIDEQIRSGGLQNFELRARSKSGRIINILFSSKPIELEGEAHHVTTMIDITELKQADEQLRYQAYLIENVNDAIVASDENYLITAWNAAAERTYGWKAEEVIGKRGVDLLQTQFVGTAADEMRSQISQSGRFFGEATQLRKDGTRIPVEVASIVLREESGKTTGYVSVNRDITERKRVEDELRTLNAELELHVAKRTEELNRTNIELAHANKAKDEFLATMSHELRTPLNSIMGLSESLLEERRGSLNPYQQHVLGIIGSSGQHLLELINDILDLAKIDAGKFDYYPQAVSVDEVCRVSIAFVKEQAIRKSITIRYDNEKTISKIYADPRRLKQILVNLLSNAVKFTPEKGNVGLEVTCDVPAEIIRFSVIDTGIGIAPENLPKLFQPFVQVDSQLNRQYAGTGLGLTLVQKLTDLQGGSVAVETELGKGSRFTINLPYSQDKIEPAAPQAPQPVQSNAWVDDGSQKMDEENIVILLAEDNPTNILTLKDYLESYGYRMLIAHDGAEAIEIAADTHPDLILMDIQMPVMDGLEAIRHLRAAEYSASIPIIALTALAMPGDRERCLEAGASEYISKPVSLKILRQKIMSLLKK